MRKIDLHTTEAALLLELLTDYIDDLTDWDDDTEAAMIELKTKLVAVVNDETKPDDPVVVQERDGRWVHVVKTNRGFDHVRLDIAKQSTREEAIAFVLQNTSKRPQRPSAGPPTRR